MSGPLPSSVAPSADAERLLVPEGARLMHIGPHKTGSTAIQTALWQLGDELAAHGVTYVSGGKRARAYKAGWAFGLAGRPGGTARPPLWLWHRFVRWVEEAGDHRVCISNEDFARATATQAAELVEELGGESVHVVAVARRLDRYLPSQWQQRIRAGDVRDFDAWLRVVLSESTDVSEQDAWERRNVWFAHDLERLVARWVDVVGEDRFTLIVNDEDDRELQPRTVEAMLGLPSGLLQPDPTHSNRSLTWSETELVRQVNVLVADQGWTKPQRRRYIKRGVLDELQRRPASSGPGSPPLPTWAVERVREISDRRVDLVRSLGVRVIGDPANLRMPEDVPTADPPFDAPPLDLATSAAAVAALVNVALLDDGETPGSSDA